MGAFSKWTDINGLHNFSDFLAACSDLTIVITEKIHGSSMRMGYVEGRDFVGGRNESFDMTAVSPNAGFGFLGWTRECPDILARIRQYSEEIGQDVVVYGEWYGCKVQGEKIVYLQDRSKCAFAMFGLRIGAELQDWQRVAAMAARIGVATVPLLYKGALSLEELDKWRVAPSTLGIINNITDPSNLAEGIVISTIPMVKIGKDWSIAKYKNPGFSERRSERGSSVSTSDSTDTRESMETADGFIAEFWTAERLNHVMDQLLEREIDPSAAESMGALIKGMFADVMKEGELEWSKLSSDAKKFVGRYHPKQTKKLFEDARTSSLR